MSAPRSRIRPSASEGDTSGQQPKSQLVGGPLRGKANQPHRHTGGTPMKHGVDGQEMWPFPYAGTSWQEADTAGSLLLRRPQRRSLNVRLTVTALQYAAKPFHNTPHIPPNHPPTQPHTMT